MSAAMRDDALLMAALPAGDDVYRFERAVLHGPARFNCCSRLLQYFRRFYRFAAVLVDTSSSSPL